MKKFKFLNQAHYRDGVLKIGSHYLTLTKALSQIEETFWKYGGTTEHLLHRPISLNSKDGEYQLGGTIEDQIYEKFYQFEILCAQNIYKMIKSIIKLLFSTEELSEHLQSADEELSLKLKEIIKFNDKKCLDWRTYPTAQSCFLNYCELLSNSSNQSRNKILTNPANTYKKDNTKIVLDKIDQMIAKEFNADEFQQDCDDLYDGFEDDQEEEAVEDNDLDFETTINDSEKDFDLANDEYLSLSPSKEDNTNRSTVKGFSRWKKNKIADVNDLEYNFDGEEYFDTVGEGDKNGSNEVHNRFEKDGPDEEQIEEIKLDLQKIIMEQLSILQKENLEGVTSNLDKAHMEPNDLKMSITNQIDMIQQSQNNISEKAQAFLNLEMLQQKNDQLLKEKIANHEKKQKSQITKLREELFQLQKEREEANLRENNDEISDMSELEDLEEELEDKLADEDELGYLENQDKDIDGDKKLENLRGENNSLDELDNLQEPNVAEENDSQLSELVFQEEEAPDTTSASKYNKKVNLLRSVFYPGETSNGKLYFY